VYFVWGVCFSSPTFFNFIDNNYIPEVFTNPKRTEHEQKERVERRGQRREEQGKRTVCSVEQVDWRGSVGDQETLQAQALQQLGLHLGAGAGNSLDGIGSDGGHNRSELLRFDLSLLLGLADLQLVHALAVLELLLVLQGQLRQLSLIADLGSLRLELGLSHGSLTLDKGGLRAGNSLSLQDMMSTRKDKM